jgi:hypothetical protein
MSPTKLSLAGNNQIIPEPMLARESLFIDVLAGDGKSLTLFYSVRCFLPDSYGAPELSAAGYSPLPNAPLLPSPHTQMAPYRLLLALK